MQLSDRLNTITDMVPASRTAADIGCDHGFVSIALCERGICSRVIAADINAGPLEQAAKHVRQHGLEDRIDVRLGGGLSVLAPGEADTILIAGMGGRMIAKILAEDEITARSASELVLSPHREPEAVREEVQKLGFFIAEERFLEEEGKYYVVIRAERTEKITGPLTEAELLYGPCLIREKPALFICWLRNELKKQEELLEQLNGRKETASVAAARAGAEKQIGLIRTVLPERLDFAGKC